MATEKYFCFDEQGELKRIKGRLVRFLDNEAPTGSDKSAIRTSLEVSPDAAGLVQADVGTDPQNLVLHGHLGTLAYADAGSVAMGTAEVETLEVTDKVDGSLGVGITPPSLHKLMVQPTDGVNFSVSNNGSALRLNAVNNDASANVALETTASSYNFIGGNVGIGASPSYDLHVTNASTAASIGITGTGGSKDTWTVTSTDSGGKALLNFRDEDTANTVMSLHQDGKVGVNQTSPASYNSNANNLVVGSGIGSEGLTIASGTTGEGGIYFADGTTGNQQYRGYLGYGHTNDELFFGTDGVTKWKLNTTGNLVPQSSGLGIDFGSGSTLDAYELGSHTTTVGVSGSGSVTMNSSYDRIGYGIIGDTVSITGLLKVSSVSSPVGALEITLPTVPANFTESGASGGGAVAYYDASANSWSNVPFTFEEGSSAVSIKLDASTLAASDQIRLSFVYFQV